MDKDGEMVCNCSEGFTGDVCDKRGECDSYLTSCVPAHTFVCEGWR